jgi:predicted Zn-dependent peptidase
MNAIGKSELMLRRVHTPEEILAKIDRISMRDVNEIIEMIFGSEKVAFSAVGKLSKNTAELLNW